jgi:putative lipase involved disintegration of autophagic bodies
MKDHPNANLFITSHSLGGALATLYPLMLFFTKQVEMTSKIGVVYTRLAQANSRQVQR